MEFISTPEDDTLKARMAVDDRNKQPFGFLAGGASLALAENLAGVGSMALCPGKMAMGINVHGNHVKAMPYGGTVTAYGKLIHRVIHYTYGTLISRMVKTNSSQVYKLPTTS